MNLRSVKGNLFLLLCLGYVADYFTKSDTVTLLTAAAVMASFVLGLFGVRKLYGFMGLVMASSAVWLTLRKGGGLDNIAHNVVTNLPLISLLIVVPLLSIPFREEGYFASVQALIRSWTTNARRIFAAIGAYLFVFGPVLNIGALRIVHDMIKDLELDERLLARSYFTGFSTVITWSPFFASVALVMSLLDVTVAGYVSVGLPFAFLEILVGYGLFWLTSRKAAPVSGGEALPAGDALTREDRNKVLALLGMMLAIVASIFCLEAILRYPIILIVVLVSMACPVLWAAFRNKWRQLYAQFVEFKRHSVAAMDNELVLFVSAGMFGAALAGTSASEGIQSVLGAAASFSFPLFCVGVLCAMALLGLAGIHPILVVTVLLSQLDPAAIGARPEALALLFMVGWVIMAIISPVTPLNFLVSRFLNRSHLEVGLKYNAWYLACLTVLTAFYVTLFR